MDWISCYELLLDSFVVMPLKRILPSTSLIIEFVVLTFVATKQGDKAMNQSKGIMLRSCVIILCLLGMVWALAQWWTSTPIVNEPASLYLTVSVSKDAYLLGEAIPISFQVTNGTDSPQLVNPWCLPASNLKLFITRKFGLPHRYFLYAWALSDFWCGEDILLALGVKRDRHARTM